MRKALVLNSLILVIFIFFGVKEVKAAELIFNSGFEADARMVGLGDITGVDHSVPAPNNWGTDTWDYDFNYVSGNSGQRKAEIVDDPTGAINPLTGQVNKVLHFWLREAPLGQARTRVAAQIHQLDRTEWFSRRRIYVHPDFLLLSNYSGGSRVMFEEIKVFDSTSPPNFRITLAWGDIGKGSFVWEVDGGELNGDDYWYYSKKTSLPIGEWFTAETYYKAGDNNTGRYVFSIQRKGHPKEVLFDVTDWTHNPNQAVAPAKTWNPQKLYMSKGGDVDWIRNNGGVAQLYFDDWEVWSTKPDGGSTPTPTKKPTSTSTPGVPGDLDKDGDVDIFDYNILIENFGNPNCGNVADIDGNCKVDIFDYNILVENFGK